MAAVFIGLAAVVGVIDGRTPSFLMAPAMYIANTLSNFVLVSGSGQAAAVMPIMVPLSALLGITRQATVLAYNFGDGFCNYILPHSTALMGINGRFYL